MMNIKSIICFVAGVLACCSIDAQTTTQNYIKVKTYRSADGTISSDKITYYDELGRQNETVSVLGSPQTRDLVAVDEYDRYGRHTNTWLPGVSTSSTGDYTDEATIKQSSCSFNNNSQPYTITCYEPSPLNRAVKEYGAGASWHSNGKYISTAYEANGTDQDNKVIHFTLDSKNWSMGNYIITNSGYYSSQDLSAVVTTDEDNNKTYVFTDVFGKKVLERKFCNGAHIDTYYIYDSQGNLLAVLPPKAADEMQVVGISTDVFGKLGNLVYIYNYDYRGRLIGKKFPGSGMSYNIYDQADNLILSRNPNGIVTFHIPDVYGRICLEGTCTCSSDAFSLNVNKDRSIPLVTATEGSGGEYFGYMIKGLVLKAPHFSKIVYYDNYDYLNKDFFPVKCESAFSILPSKYNIDRQSLPVGKQTGSIVALLNDSVTENYIYSSIYYNYKSKPIATYESNEMGGYDMNGFKYDYTGNVLEKYHVNTTDSIGTVTEDFTYTYDNQNRLLTEAYSLDGKPAKTIVRNTYDPLGRLSELQQGSMSSLTSKYTYDVRSKITQISSPVFIENIYYNNKRSSVSNACYNGNISSVSWTYKTSAAALNISAAYDYSYDSLNRLVLANYTDSENRTYFYDAFFSYDKQGNILCLSRNNISPEDPSKSCLIDDAEFNYNGNQLNAYSDIGEESATSDITLPNNYDSYGKLSSSTQFAYDSCGNMTANTNKNIIKITYNILNLPSNIYFKDGSVISYTYDANGVKRRVVYGSLKYNIAIPSTNIMTQSITAGDISDYKINSSEFYDDRLVFYSYYVMSNRKQRLKYDLSEILIDGGVVRDITSSGFNIYYQIVDHLGNVRYVSSNGSTLGAIYNYYPFGGDFGGGGYRGYVWNYRYNGKRIDTANNLDMYDYQARSYDPSLARFTTMDPLAEKHPDVSPYAYCADNPIRYIDPDGRKIYCGTHDAVYYDAQSGKYVCNNYANAGTREIVSALGLTKEGTKMFKMAVMSPTKISFVLSNQTKIAGKTFDYGKTDPGNKNSKDSFGIRIGTKGYYKNKAYYTTATITLYKGTIAKDALAPNSKHPGMSIEEAIGAVAGHEITHAANPTEVNADIRYEMSHVDKKGNPLSRPTTEVEALHVEGIIDNESLNR